MTPSGPSHGRPRILCVDDEPAVLDGLRRQLRGDFVVVGAQSGEEAFSILEGDGPFVAIVSDMRMPGINGSAVLARSRLIAPDTVRLLLTGQADLEDAVAAVNEGNIFRFLIKPCPGPTLVAALHDAVEQRQLILAEKELCEKTLRGSIAALLDTLALANPMAFARASRIQAIVVEMITAVDAPDRWRIEVAAMLSQIGTVVLSPETVAKLHSGLPLSADEQVAISRLPQVAEQLLTRIPRLDEVRHIILAQGAVFAPERGLDSGLVGEDIPIGARILRLATDLDTLEAAGVRRGDALDVLSSHAGIYDPALIAALHRKLAAEEAPPAPREIVLGDLMPGMTIAEDVTDSEGRLLVGRGYQVTPNLIERIFNWRRTTKIGDRICIIDQYRKPDDRR